MPLFSVLLLLIQAMLLLVFSYFAFFKYLYGFASLRSVQLSRVPASGKRCAVVVVAFNEEYVVEETLNACDALTYSNKLVVLADDSSDPAIIQQRIRYAKQRGCVRLDNHPYREHVRRPGGGSEDQPIEIWESPDFVLLLRPSNTGFKAGSLKRVHEFLTDRDIGFIYPLDADWHPQPDALERAFEILEADDNLAFVQTKRIARPGGMNLFQKINTVLEEACYFVDFQGRQVLQHPILFSGCCALMRLNAIADVGGFQPGELTEDLDLTNRLWLAGWKGAYATEITNTGEVPFTYEHFRRQQERWAAGTSASLRTYTGPILRSRRLTVAGKMSVLRQNSYFFCSLFVALAFVVGVATVGLTLLFWNSYQIEYYLFVVQKLQHLVLVLIYLCVFSTVFGPIIMLTIHKRQHRDLIYLPLSLWCAWSVIHSYVIGSVKGMMRHKQDWYRTPKLRRSGPIAAEHPPTLERMAHILSLVFFLAFYFAEGWAFAWLDLFAMLWVPSMILASTNGAVLGWPAKDSRGDIGDWRSKRQLYTSGRARRA